MKPDHLLSLWSLLSILVVSQTIPEVLSTYSQLSTLASYVNLFPSLAQQLKSADNFTFLAPANDAFSTWLESNNSNDYIEATLTCPLLNGTHPSVSLSSTPLFLPTALTNTSWCNVTGGQRVKAVNDGKVVFGSALNTNGTVLTADMVATGGLVPIIDTVLYMPFDALQTITALNLSYYIAIANEAGFLSAEDRPFIDIFEHARDLTSFLANSAQALATLNDTG